MEISLLDFSCLEISIWRFLRTDVDLHAGKDVCGSSPNRHSFNLASRASFLKIKIS